MIDRSSIDLSESVEWLSTWYDHFRHIYEFIKALHDAIETNHVDYDNRQRFTISKENFGITQTNLQQMIEKIDAITKPLEITISAAKTYPDFTTYTSVQREFNRVLEHAEIHRHYTQKTNQHHNSSEHESYALYQKRNISLTHIQNILTDIQQDTQRYQSISHEHISHKAQVSYQIIAHKIKQLSYHETDDILIFQGAYTSVGNEYYKIEEELVHVLYDIRLHTKNDHQDLFDQLLEQDPDFWIARSTLQS